MIPQFLESVKHLEIDKLWINFYPQAEAYSLARDEFLKRKEYTHFVMLIDDLLVKQLDIDFLLADNKDVISGWCNNNTTTHSADSSISFILPPDPPSSGTYEGYEFVPIKQIEHMTGIMSVKHQATALTILTRKIIEKVPFRHSGGCCIDSCLSIDLDKAGIKQYVDMLVRTQHLKVNDAMQAKISLVDKLPREIKFERY